MPSLRRSKTPAQPRPGEKPLTSTVSSSVVASAALVSQRSFRRIQRNVGWQTEAWGYYDSCPTLRVAVGWLASACSRAQLFIGLDDPGSQDDPQPLDDELAEEVLMELGGGRGNSQMLRMLATHLSVAGESYLTGWDDPGNGDRLWHPLSADDVKIVGSKLAVDQGDGVKLLLSQGQFQMIRIWRPHPRWAAQADSPVRSLGGDLAELMGLSQHVLATIDSRLAGAGVLVIPESVTAPPVSGDQEHDDPVMAALIEAMTTPIQDRDSASAVVPLLLRVPDESAGKVEHIKFGTDFDARILDLRDAAIARVAAGVELPAEIVSGLGETNHWCVDATTQALTREGWRTHDRLAPGTEVLTLDHATGLSGWQPIGELARFEVEDLEMVSIRGRRHSSLSTPAHRWPVLRGEHAASRERVVTTSDGLGHADFMITAAPCADLPTEAKYADAFVELTAWFFAGDEDRGPAGRDGSRAVISRSEADPGSIARITRALTALYGPPADGPLDTGARRSTLAARGRRAEARRLRDQEGLKASEIAARLGVGDATARGYLNREPSPDEAAPGWSVRRDGRLSRFILNPAAGAPLTDLAPDRIVPPEFVQALTAAQLELFIDTAVRADGPARPGDTRRVSRKDPARLAAFELAVILSGRSPHTYDVEHDGSRRPTRVQTGFREDAVFGPRARSVSRVRHTGTVWCPTTPNTTWLARRDGTVFYTGNTAWQIEESAVKVYVNPLVALICDALTIGYLRPALKQVSHPRASQLVIWYDTSDLVLRPDRSQESVALHDRGLLSDEATRRENGFDEDDAPSTEELNRWILLQLAKDTSVMAPGLVPHMTKGVGPIQIAPIGTEPTATDTASGPGPSAPAAPSGAAAPGSPARRSTGTGTRSLPSGRSAPPAPGGGPPGAAATSGPVVMTGHEATVAAAEAAVLRALEIAGKRLLPTQMRGRLAAVPAWELHTHLDPGDPDRLLEGAFALLHEVVASPCVIAACQVYTRTLLDTRSPHRRDVLDRVLAVCTGGGPP
jgi:hypothetical protein